MNRHGKIVGKRQLQRQTNAIFKKICIENPNNRKESQLPDSINRTNVLLTPYTNEPPAESIINNSSTDIVPGLIKPAEGETASFLNSDDNSVLSNESNCDDSSSNERIPETLNLKEQLKD